MSRLLVLTLFVLAAAPMAARQPVPPDLVRLAEKARLSGPISAWCRGELRPGRSSEFAVAIAGAAGGRYVVLQAEGTVAELAAFRRGPELSCYSRARALELNRTIRRSESVQGRITPRWNTTVVCGFVEDTMAVCWQYSPVDRTFVEVGGWTT